MDPLICQQAHGYTSLSGLQYSADTNLCRNADPSTGGLPPIVVPPVIAAFDPFAVAIASQIRQIQVKANQECRAAATDNRVLAEHLVNVFRERAKFKAAQMTTMADWLNSVAKENPSSTNHPLILTALESAGRNLSPANQDGFKFEILQPQGNEYIRLEEAQARASVFFINFQEQGNGCVGRPGFQDFDGVPVSFSKTESVVTYFAVKLTSHPKLLFMPARWIEDGFPELTAYASAKPFGSRLGPDGTLDQLVPVPNRPGNVSRLINFSFVPNDNRGIFNTKIMAYLDALHPFNSAGRPDGNEVSGWPEPNKSENLRAALQAIRAPTIFDGLMYSVFPDPGANRQQDYLEPQYAEALYPDYLEAADPQQNGILQMDSPRTPAYLPQGVGSRNNGPGWIQINADANGGGDGYGNYATEQIASHSTTTVLGLPEMNDPRSFGFADPTIVHSGWTPNGKPGRIGYSVKFIGMDALRRTLRVRQNGAEGRISNPPHRRSQPR